MGEYWGGGEGGGEREEGLFCCQKNSIKPVPGQTSSVTWSAGAGLRYGKNMRIVVLKVFFICPSGVRADGLIEFLPLC